MVASQTLPHVVVVTGAGGYAGTELTKQLLDRGYTVRATVRDKNSSSVAHLEPLGKALPGVLHIVEADLNAEGSFDKAIEGATFVFHTASPATFGSGDPAQDQKDIVDPAVNGTATVMHAAAKAGVKRVVITGSVAALHPLPMVDLPLQTPENWNTVSTLEDGAYLFSKTQAEQKAWKLSKELGVDLVTILPSMIVGPVVSRRGGYSVDTVAALAKGGPWDALYMTPASIDVRDVALAHILAAEKPSANGRYILSRPNLTDFRKVMAALACAFPDIPFPEPDAKPIRAFYDVSKVEKELGLQFIPVEQSFTDQVRTSAALGLLD